MQLPLSRTMATPEPYKDSYLDDVRPAPGFFDAFRVGNFPTLYPSIKTSESTDILLAGYIFAAVILVFSLLLIVPGVRRWHVSNRQYEKTQLVFFIPVITKVVQHFVGYNNEVLGYIDVCVWRICLR